jgi:hypothetical protein
VGLKCVLLCPGREMSTHYFSCSFVPGADHTKTTLGHVTPNLCFCIRWDLLATYCVVVHPGCEFSMHHFSWSGWPSADPNKSVHEHVT